MATKRKNKTSTQSWDDYTAALLNQGVDTDFIAHHESLLRNLNRKGIGATRTVLRLQHDLEHWDWGMCAGTHLPPHPHVQHLYRVHVTALEATSRTEENCVHLRFEEKVPLPGHHHTCPLATAAQAGYAVLQQLTDGDVRVDLRATGSIWMPVRYTDVDETAAQTAHHLSRIGFEVTLATAVKAA